MYAFFLLMPEPSPPEPYRSFIPFILSRTLELPMVEQLI